MSAKSSFAVQQLVLDNPVSKSIMFVLAHVANDTKQQCWPSQEYIAKCSGAGLRSVQRHIKILERMGYITIRARAEKGMQTSNIYTICVDKILQDGQTQWEAEAEQKGYSPVKSATPQWRVDSNKPATQSKQPATVSKQPARVADESYKNLKESYREPPETRSQADRDTGCRNIGEILQGLRQTNTENRVNSKEASSTRASTLHDDLTDTSWAH